MEIKKLLLNPGSTLREVMTCIDRNARGVALVVDEGRRLLRTVTDGDIRRAILAGVDLEAPVTSLEGETSGASQHRPITARTGTTPEELLEIMRNRSLRHIPILDDTGRVVDLVMLDDLVAKEQLPIRAVIMAGGFGTRMRPLTEELPKPMLPVGGRPLLEHTLEQLREVGIHRATITTHHKPEMIRQHFGDGSSFGVALDYVNEDEPLGTGGSLGLLPDAQEPLLVINGDVLTRVDFQSMLAYHQQHNADMTVGVREYGLSVAFGVIECDGCHVTALREKPEIRLLVNAGIYLLDPSVQGFVPRGERFDMPDLINWLLDAGRVVVSFPIIEYWVDIGEPAEYERAQNDAQTRESTP